MHRLALFTLLLVTMAAGGCRERPAAVTTPTPPATPTTPAATEAPGRTWTFTLLRDEDPARAFSVRVVSTRPLQAPSLRYSRGAALAADAKTTRAHVRRVQGVERWVYAFELDALEPDAVYAYQVFDADTQLSALRRHKTLPASGPVRLAFGGDAYVTPTTRQIFGQVAKHDAAAFVIGGDLAYGNGQLGNMALWDGFLDFMQDAVARADGTHVPFVIGIGNHEVKRKLVGRVTAADAPWYFAFFSDLSDADDAREAYFSLPLSDHAALVVLDSGHLTSHENQVPFLRKALTAHAARPLKIATYHIPLYPSVRDPDTTTAAVRGREHWLPLFDEHALTVAFENHDHALKRTPRMRGGKPHEAGTLYLGDGCIGNHEREPDASRAYLAKTSGKFHVWIADLQAGGLKARAIAPDGAQLDEVELRLAPGGGAQKVRDVEVPDLAEAEQSL
jgi:hypothetical protein